MRCFSFKTNCYQCISVSTFAQVQVERCGTHFVRANSRNSTQDLCRFIYKHSRYCILQSFWYSLRSCRCTNFGTLCVLIFLYPFQRLRKRKLDGYKKTECTLRMHSAKLVVGVARLVRREPCLRKGTRRNSDCYFVNRVSVSFGRATS